MSDQDVEKQFGKPPESKVRRWLMELKQADKREKEWRAKAAKIYARYRSEAVKASSFNILWANTETLRPALYNSTPKPDVRRRFRDSDIIGKAVSEIMERSIAYTVDCANFDERMKLDVLDGLLPGRGVSRVKYVPTTSGEEGDESLDYERVEVQHVPWDDFRRGPGRTWDELPWVGFRHRLTASAIKEKFGEEVSDAIKMDTPADEDLNKRENKDIEGVFSTAEFWEIWDKDGKKVFFVNQNHKELITPIGQDDSPPLDLSGFFPIPEALRLIEDSESLIPIPHYSQYEEQAKELDRLSARITKIVAALKVRGVYDATLSEMSELMKGEDNDLIPLANASAWADRGGFEKAIAWMPIEQAAKVLAALYEAREACKQVIYELTGISDIVRGSSNANETATAQRIKNQWGTLRLQRMQREVQRYARDLIRLIGEVIADKFQPETMATMTGLQFPTAQQKQMAQMQAQQTGQQPDPEMMNSPTWEDIMKVMRSDMLRDYRIDIETDSTIAATLEEDMKGLQEVLTGIINFVQGIAPAIQSGAFPIEAAKAIVMTICRRSKMGLEVEDALEKIQAPQQQADPNAAQAQAQAQSDKAKLDHEMQLEQMRMQQAEQHKQMELQVEQQKAQQEAELEQTKLALESQAANQELAMEEWKAKLDAETKLTIAAMQIEAKSMETDKNLQAQATQHEQKLQAEAAPQDEDLAEKADMGAFMQQVMSQLEELLTSRNAPMKFERGPDGMVASVNGRPVNRGPDGLIQGIG